MLTLALQKALITQGPAYGIRQPIVVVNLTAPASALVSWEVVDTVLASVLESKAQQNQGIDPSRPFPQQLALRLLKFSRLIQTNAGLGLHARGKILGVRTSAEGLTISSVALPYVAPYAGAGFRVARWVFNAIQQLLTGTPSEALEDEFRQSYQKLRDELLKLGPRDTNTLRFIHAALRADIPHAWLNGPLFQYGWGRRQCLLNSSILETTASMGVATARDKHACSTLLRIGGLPVPEHGLAADLSAAKSLALRLGYPVVVKPANLDGGVGVAAGLQNEQQLEQAWESAREHSDKILVEKHLAGQDFRLIVLDGHMVWAVGRQPAGVTGDGQQTVSQLVEKANLDPRRGHHVGATLRPIVIDDEAMSLLQEQQLTVDAVPAVDQFVTLRRAANISSGGTPSVVTDQVHPDNRLLVERAVTLLRLDLAGVDLIVPDIARSWRETGGGIIEINAQPQMVAASQTHLYEQVLRARLPHGGRIPVVLFMGDEAVSPLAQGVYEGLRAQGHAPGLAIGAESWFPDGSQGATTRSPYDATRALLTHPDVGVALWVVRPQDVLSHGLPVDCFDGLVMAGVCASKTDATPAGEFQKALTMVLPHCGQWVLDADGIAQDVIRGLGLPAESSYDSVLDRSALQAEVQQRIRQAFQGAMA